MKPNPVKKTVEYCNILAEAKCDQFGYDQGGDAICKKYKKGLSKERINGAVIGHRYRRPSWCTYETFVRVKIEPAITGEKEYCVYTNKHCRLLELSWNNDTKDHFCPITDEYFSGSRMVIERPESCRKLAVE